MTVVLQATDKLVGMLGKVWIVNILSTHICMETVISHERTMIDLVVKSSPWHLARHLHLCLRMCKIHRVELGVYLLLLELLHHLQCQYCLYVDWRLWLRWVVGSLISLQNAGELLEAGEN